MESSYHSFLVLPLLFFPTACFVGGFVLHGLIHTEVFTEARMFLKEMIKYRSMYCRDWSGHVP